ncbi:hypothetical protein [Gilvimarinus xylanilyticus]|uniref:Cytochrome c-552/4 domain-containing protein n=1 Tax=Gilvimarinus xylanilyticus TaxID=2944139 RepID=A0A9X2KSB2_9GAMM|nr:hypothetical protein [Gilvimarinus xylanilyticus]MCP8898064.1 hypothetical protein [Gilvimarinus xylanilyticus]
MRNRFLFHVLAAWLYLPLSVSASQSAGREALAVDLNSLECAQSTSSPDLPLPSSLPLVDYEKTLYSWIIDRQYADLGWCHDKEVRDTGPFINGQYHGTHPAVLIYYSPEMMRWLLKRKKGVVGPIPDGAIIIKEMYGAPAQIYRDIRRLKSAEEYETLRLQQLSDWTVMVKDASASHDGWFWGSVSAPTMVDGKLQTKTEAIEAQLDTQANNNRENSYVANNGVRLSGFGMPCLRCHSSAESELTFASLRNIKGFEAQGDPLRFLDDNSWRTASHFSQYPLSLLLQDPKLKAIFDIPLEQLPWATQQSVRRARVNASFNEHDRDALLDENEYAELTAQSKKIPANYINQAFLKTFPQIPALKASEVKKFPQQWLDHVVQKTGEPQAYVTSDNCIGCHGGLSADTFGTEMFVVTGPDYGDGFDLSEYGEWRYSPMGLAGRDPIFHAQLESEMAILRNDAKNPDASGLKGPLKETQQAVTNTCLSCHGAMGQRQLSLDAEQNPHLDQNFNTDYFYYTEQLSSDEKQGAKEKQYHQYGALAREGISCMVCHRIQEPDAKAVANWAPPSGWVNTETPDKELAYLLFHNSTGRFDSAEPGNIYGPYDVAQKPMEHALNLTPSHSDFIKRSELCGTCHTINLPNIGSTDTSLPVLQAAETNPAFSEYPHSIEQATFLEWQNSAFARGDTAQSCQDCHMPSNFVSESDKINIDQLISKIATIEDNSYPDADHGLANSELKVPLREEYKRHTHVGLNAFLLTMFKQFQPMLGVAPQSYMTSASNQGIDLALASMKRQARDDTVAMSVDQLTFDGDTLVVDVTARNKVGHRFPSGVAFRRGFIELLVKDGDNLVWSSGRTNDAGVIVDHSGKPLPTEFLPEGECGYSGNKPAGCYQPHHQVITNDKQVQIYEELNRDKSHHFTTSFVHRVHIVKDNRLLPDGWRASSYFKPQGEVMTQFMEATDPHFVGDDPDYRDQGMGFVGKDSLQYRIDLPQEYRGKPLKVEATMYYQAIPPYWLKQRFDLAPEGEATRRLHYLASRLNLDGSILAQWKFKINTATATLAPVNAH